MNRKLISILIVLSGFFVSSCAKNDSQSDSPADTSKPNILLIIADDMGLDATPGYALGSTKPIMPNIQNLIDTGIRFTNFWANPTCTPTRSAILTGKYGFRINMTQVGDVLSTSETSLQDYLTDNSTYSNALIGKWHLSTNASHPNTMGVGYYAGLLSGAAQSYTDWNFTENGQMLSSTEYMTTKFSNLAIDWLDKQSDPWFLWLAYTAPHTPFHLPPANLHTQTGLSSNQTSIDANPLPYYMAMLEAMDTEIGRVLSSLNAEELDNTLIIFIGDNGSPNQVVQEYNSNRVKGTVYQGGINVPLIIAGEGVTRNNSTEAALINSTDLFATIASIAGISVSNTNDSQSFIGLLTDENSSTRDYVYAEIGKSSGGSDYTIRNQTHKYIKFDTGTEALYNLSQNPLESPNLLHANQLPLSDANEAIKNELLTKLAEIRQ
ncbi:MAG: sulfatase-like hydrolase/transferase [Flavobacteriaceae bacterium]